MSTPEQSAIKHWKQPFRHERDVTDQFAKSVDALLKMIEDQGSSLRREAEDLEFAKELYQAWVTEPEGQTNRFLTPSVNAAAKCAGVLWRDERPHDAFWTCNIFGEMCKILVSRRRDKYQQLFEDLLQTACYSISDSWRADISNQRADSEVGEISKLSTHMKNMVCQYALGSFFNGRTGEFMRSGRPDTVLGESLVNNALARHFDKQIRHLLENDRPRVKEYARTNMPFVYGMDLPEKWAAAKRKEWKQLLSEAGFDEDIRLLEDMGDLLNPDEVGQISLERREDVMRAAANNDLDRVSSLLSESAKELKSYLYKEAQDSLQYREPTFPALPDPESRRHFAQVQRLSRTDDPDRMRQALNTAQSVWQRSINNLELRDWVSYLQAKTGNLPAAEQMLEQIQKKRAPKRNFATDWNLAVLTYDRKNEAGAYQLLVPLLEDGILDEDLITVILALSLKLNDLVRFLETVPQTMSLRFHPLALVVAHQMNNIDKVEDLLAQLLRHWQGKWELPNVSQRFDDYEEFEQTVNRAIVEGQTEQLVAWLQARINYNKNWVPNYLALANVLAEEVQDVEGAFQALRDRFSMVRKKRELRLTDEACRDMLEFCKKSKRNDLGQRAYQIAKDARVNEDLLRSFSYLDPEPGGRNGGTETALPVEKQPEIGREKEYEKKTAFPSTDPKLPERLAWVTARLAGIRTVSSYLEEFKAIEEFSKIVSEVNPQESATAVDLIRNTSTVIETFSHSATEDRDSRRVLYDRATDYEKRLTHLLKSGALSQHLADVITPYGQALKQVIGDLSRQAGIGPVVEANVENSFISFESRRSTLVLRITNKSQRAVTDVIVEILVDTPVVTVIGKRERKIDKLGAQQSHLFSFPISHSGDEITSNAPEVVLGISLRASAEGFPNVDLGIKKQAIPVSRLSDAIGVSQIPKLFQPGKPLNPSDPSLFQGREDVLAQIKGSFYGGVQRERYFLDGIRRVGKTSILNFLPNHLPENLIPVRVNFDKLNTSGPINSPAVLYSFCTSICVALAVATGITLDVPSESLFESSPGQTFEKFLIDVQSAYPGHVPLLMIDEFQDLLKAIARTGSKDDRDTVVLDQMRAQLEEGKLNALFTGSIRFDRLSGIIDHRIFGSLRRMRVSFLTEEGVGNVIRAGLEKWVKVPQETIKRVYELTGGYPWLAQTYGSGIVDLINQEHRSIVTPEDVDHVTNESVISDNELFGFWWPTDQLGIEEERFIEHLFRNYPGDQSVSTPDFISAIHSTQQPAFKRALENLRASEVLDSTQNQVLRFRGSVLRTWLEQQMQDGQLRIRPATTEPIIDRGQAGIFIDHENLIRGLERISVRRGVDVPADKLDWFTRTLDNLLLEAERRVGPLSYKVTVAFWSRPNEARLLPPYFARGFSVAQPEEIKIENAVDFKVADEVRRARETAMREGKTLSRAIIISGDGDLSHAARALINDGVNVHVWGGSKDTGAKYVGIVGEKNFVALDDVSGL
jgi:hypothetical protein